jgi:tRNA G18 (ribose-2'-O)-methylase SpoU
MPSIEYNIYECDNPACRLRFPGYENHPRWNLCPNCRSKTRIVTPITDSSNKVNQDFLPNRLHIETLLDNIRSGWNVGSIFRTSDGVGIQKLYLCGITPGVENSQVRKTALGAELIIPWEKSNNGVKTATELKSSGYLLWVLEDLPNSLPLFQIDVTSKISPILLVVGNEVTGVDPGIINISDKVISIPMVGQKRSYNVAVAFGIAVSFLLYRQSVSQGSRNIFPRT